MEAAPFQISSQAGEGGLDVEEVTVPTRPMLNIGCSPNRFKLIVQLDRRKPRQTYESLVMSFSSQLWNLTQAKQLTGKEHIVLQALQSFEGDKGIFPSHTSIAVKAGCSVRTVINALNKAYELGLVERFIRRIVHKQSGRIVRGTNFYTLKTISLTGTKARLKARTQKLKECLERKKKRFLVSFSKCNFRTGSNPKSFSIEDRRSHLPVQDYLRLISKWSREHKSPFENSA